jgi:hypothetical protein
MLYIQGASTQFRHIGFRLWAGAKDFCIIHTVQTGYWNHLATRHTCAGVSFVAAIQWTAQEFENSPLTNSEAKTHGAKPPATHTSLLIILN